MSSIKDVDTNYQGIFGETRLVPWLAAYGMPASPTTPASTSAGTYPSTDCHLGLARGALPGISSQNKCLRGDAEFLDLSF